MKVFADTFNTLLKRYQFNCMNEKQGGLSYKEIQMYYYIFFRKEFKLKKYEAKEFPYTFFSFKKV